MNKSDAHHTCDLVVLGSGCGGYAAALRAADLGLSVILVGQNPIMGGSRAAVTTPVGPFCRAMGMQLTRPRRNMLFDNTVVDLGAARAVRVCSKNGQRRPNHEDFRSSEQLSFLQGVGKFLDPQTLVVEETLGLTHEKAGHTHFIHFKVAIVATGAVFDRPPFLPCDPRVVDSASALNLRTLPRRILIVGDNHEALHVGVLYATLMGSEVDVVETSDCLMAPIDGDLVSFWKQVNAPHLHHLMLASRIVRAMATDEGILVRFEGKNAPSHAKLYDMVVYSSFRPVDANLLGLDRAGIALNHQGHIAVDDYLRTSVPHVFAIGRVLGPGLLNHKAEQIAHLAAEAAARQIAGKADISEISFSTFAIPRVIFSAPEIAWVGQTENPFHAPGSPSLERRFLPLRRQGLSPKCDEKGFVKLLVDSGTERVVGGGIVGAGAGELIEEIAQAVRLGMRSDNAAAKASQCSI